MRWTAWGTILPLLLALSSEASAQPASQAGAAPFPTAKLDYQVAAGLACPTAGELRTEVAKQIHYDAFDDGPGFAVGRFHVIVARKQPGVLRVKVSLEDVSGHQDFETEFDGKPETSRTCSHLVKMHVVAEIVTALTTKAMARILRDRPAGAACSGPKAGPIDPAPCRDSRFAIWPDEWPLPPLPKPKPDPPTQPERWPFAMRFGVAAWPEEVASGWGSLGISAEVGVRYRAVSVGVEAHGDPPLGSVVLTSVGPTSFARASGTLLACASLGWFTGCGVGDAGRFIFPNHVRALPATVFYAAAGVRAGVDVPVAPPRLFVRAAVDLRAPIRPVSYTFMGNTIFETAGPSVGLGLGLLAELPL